MFHWLFSKKRINALEEEIHFLKEEKAQLVEANKVMSDTVHRVLRKNGTEIDWPCSHCGLINIETGISITLESGTFLTCSECGEETIFEPMSQTEREKYYQLLKSMTKDFDESVKDFQELRREMLNR